MATGNLSTHSNLAEAHTHSPEYITMLVVLSYLEHRSGQTSSESSPFPLDTAVQCFENFVDCCQTLPATIHSNLSKSPVSSQGTKQNSPFVVKPGHVKLQEALLSSLSDFIATIGGIRATIESYKENEATATMVRGDLIDDKVRSLHYHLRDVSHQGKQLSLLPRDKLSLALQASMSVVEDGRKKEKNLHDLHGFTTPIVTAQMSAQNTEQRDHATRGDVQ
ncbi:hypothetical protein TREMEDRAFT_59930 [Tremella mesenterica DSM 1558]|uniref:uncharacterized protein n=1 Tax=Tremella mesenterica (strain ATCC 24925 / CBS 8224 / DSM 1558 / NBRC 9311 / NRRL Y-6157 / RJB 2259-6 / UBC 559-6) TaxID=578456 RepID=UPI0003F49B81|nr:uncharacterized protein TREMEDRAFT_59930 [Tremella mesenterica DSM 1558]EIW70991.1 hypothetical protein TREMEDRAFT_59930 [Tremella mesenterica DSM 1558]